jgi:hypothetical protein
MKNPEFEDTKYLSAFNLNWAIKNTKTEPIGLNGNQSAGFLMNFSAIRKL